MAKLTLNSALSNIRGRIDNWVYRHLGDRMIIARRPEFTGPPSPAQVAVRDRFRQAAAYGRMMLGDPVRLPLYQAAAKARKLTAFAVALGDFLKPPEVMAIDATAYHGQAGDTVRVAARDDFAVAAVDIVIRDQADAVLEEGPATFTEGAWTYTATAAVAAGESVTIKATARDHPGHTGSLSQDCLIA